MRSSLPFPSAPIHVPSWTMRSISETSGTEPTSSMFSISMSFMRDMIWFFVSPVVFMCRKKLEPRLSWRR